ncbi:hypothetical protein G9A89_011868 [Geosiphon pyriformis]|nr:hypothetical protein G9A89_011868 [Geosiphon pyriformis]
MRRFWRDLSLCISIFVVSFVTLIYVFGSPKAARQQPPTLFETSRPPSAPEKKVYNEVTLTLRHIYHHGSTGFPELFRRLDLNETRLNSLQLSSDMPFTHIVRGVPSLTVKPTDRNMVKEYRRRHKYDQISTKIDYHKELAIVPDMKNQETVIALAMMTYNAYIPTGSEDWYDLGHKYGWNDEFGWQEDGIRGHVFTDPKNETIVIAIKGTSMIGGGPTVPKDKKNDNRLFSCCCARVGPSWTPVCGCYRGKATLDQCDQRCLEESVDESDLYYDVAVKLYERIQDTYPDATIWLTGHSLGGGVSGLIGWTYGVPAVGFEAPGEALAARRLHLPQPPALPYEDMPIWHVGHTADPIFMGACNAIWSSCWVGGYALETKCHAGKVCLYDSVKEFGWKPDVRTHRARDVIEKVLKVWSGVPVCRPEVDCVDCGLWEFVDN